jgi:hypothetical protein
MINITEEIHGHYVELVESLFQHLKDKLEGWKLSDKDWEGWTVLPGEKEPTDDWRRGYNAGVESVSNLVDMLLDEQI